MAIVARPGPRRGGTRDNRLAVSFAIHIPLGRCEIVLHYGVPPSDERRSKSRYRERCCRGRWPRFGGMLTWGGEAGDWHEVMSVRRLTVGARRVRSVGTAEPNARASSQCAIASVSRFITGVVRVNVSGRYSHDILQSQTRRRDPLRPDHHAAHAAISQLVRKRTLSHGLVAIASW